MKTIETELTVVPNGKSILEVLLPPDVSPGKHRAILVIEDQPISEAKGKGNASKFDPDVVFSKYEIELLNPDQTFRREEIYNDDGR